MRGMKLAIAGLSVLVIASVAMSCGGGAAPAATTTTQPLQTQPPQVVKPKPVVVAVVASTTGVFDSYCAIVDSTIRNDGTEGVVVVVGNMSQGDQTTRSELPIYMARNATMTVRQVFPLKWKGGDWMPNIQVEVP